MALYTEEDLRDFVKYAKDYLSTHKNDTIGTEDRTAVEGLLSILTTLHYNAVVFESFLARSKIHYLLTDDLTQLPLHLNDSSMVSQIIIKWRLQRNK